MRMGRGKPPPPITRLVGILCSLIDHNRSGKSLIKEGDILLGKAIIVYGSNTGNTEILAGALSEELNTRFDVTTRNVIEVRPEEILDYDLIVLGSSTWNEGELQDDFQYFYDEMDEVDLTGKRVAVFGPGDSSWDEYCRAVDILEEKSIELKADLVTTGFKWDGDIDETAIKEIKKWGSQLH